MNALLESTLKHLQKLVAFDTRNPPRAINTGGIFDYLREQLPDFNIDVIDHGAGAVSMLAVRGQPRLLFNVHLDTVPDSPAWSANPFELRVDDARAVGLGACDIKGAAAALLAVANATEGDMAMLFSTDEEANDARCIAAFLHAFLPLPPGEGWGEGTLEAEVSGKVEPSPQPLSRRERGFKAVIVAEPTQGKAVLAHRGIQSVCMRFAGKAGHASVEQQPGDSALHQAVQWGHAVLTYVDAQADQHFDGMRGLRFNIGRIEGGIKANMIAPEAELRFNMRPLPTMDPDDLLMKFRTMAKPAAAHFVETFRGPSLPAGDVAMAETRRLAACDLANELGLPVGDAVNFWTEAALFSAAGYTTFVYGPGDIAQAHSADEWVALEQLSNYAASIQHVVEAGHA